MALANGAALLPIDSPVTAAAPLIIAGDELAKAGSLMVEAMSFLEMNELPMAKLAA